MKDAYSFDVTNDGLVRSYQAQRDAYERIFTRLGIEYVIVKADAGAMGGSASEEFLSPSPIGEDTFVRSAGGYAANVEAVTISAPEALSIEGKAQAVVKETPNVTSIAAVVDFANKSLEMPEITAGSTLKHIVLAVTDIKHKRSLVVVGIPGDREMEPKRAEIVFAGCEVEPANDEDFAKHPELLKGFIGPVRNGKLFLGEKGESKIRYLLDPRVVAGTSWVAGANEKDKHVFNLVAGRDFTADGIADLADIQAGDPAPDGSGPLELARGIEIGHVFQLGKKYAEALDLKVLDENGKLVTVTMGSYGIGVTRIIAVLAEANNDEKGLIWPAAVSPVDIHVVAAGKDDVIYETAEKLALELQAKGKSVLLDDRLKVSPGVKFSDAELLGIPQIVIVGRGLETGEVDLWDRRSGERRSVKVELAVTELV
jgi:prolyl-tRNA synthetase